MLLIKEADQEGRLEQFANDIDMSLKTTGNYLDAYDDYVERGLLPATFADADAVEIHAAVYEIWDDVYDYTAHTQRYDSVDRTGVMAVAEEMGLKGHGKAMDIAKNPKSMTAAILGDHRAAVAAVEAVVALAKRDPLIAAALRDHRPEMLQKDWKHTQEEPVERLRRILGSFDSGVDRLSEFDVPEGMEDFVLTHLAAKQSSIDNVRTILEGRQQLTDL
jgi:hypothetical protein